MVAFAGTAHKCFLQGHRLRSVPTAASRSTTCLHVRAQATQHQSVSRRNAAALLVAAPAWIFANKAMALIPANDDEDEELVSKAKAKRGQQIGRERRAEQRFAQSEGFSDNTVLTLQRAVKKLAKGGSQLSDGKIQEVAATFGDTWVVELRKAASAVSKSEQSQSALKQLVADLDSIGRAAKQGDASSAKRSYVSLVSSLQSWASDAGIEGRLQGI